MSKQAYLGDGVYIEWDGYSFRLITNNIETFIINNNKDKQEINLGINQWLALTRFVESLKE